MNTLVIGLGSMGRRRIRCLKELGVQNIRGFDLRTDRVNQAQKDYGVTAFTTLEEAQAGFKPDLAIISVPPDRHLGYMEWALQNKVHFFVEASVLDDGLAELQSRLDSSGVVCAPSCTLRFHPAIKLIDQIVKSGELGRLSNILLHSGQYLPDWHTYEAVSDYYVSNPATGGGREIVPFELSWFINTFGMPRRVAGMYRKTIEIEGASYIDDTYNCMFDYNSYLATVTVDVVSRYATRRLTVNGSQKQLSWAWEENCVKVFDPILGEWERREYKVAQAASGYNPNISEGMYVDEIAAFMNAAKGLAKYPNTLQDDRKILDILYRLERSDRLACMVEVP